MSGSAVPPMPDPGTSRTRFAPTSKILVIEDSPSARKLLQDLLTRLGVALPDIRIASTVSEALQIYSQWRPDVVFVDLQLKPPVDAPAAPADAATPSAQLPKDGGELALQLLQRTPSLKIVVCSASDPSGGELAALVAKGKVQSIVKPIFAAKVRTVLEKFGVPTHATSTRP
jgi:CheY-like chemotaxis protein